MRILEIVHDFVPETRAGTEINTHKLSVDLVAKGHEVYVFCRGWKGDVPSYAIRDEEFDGLPVRRVDFGEAGKAHRTTRHDPHIDQALRDYLAQVKPDLIHFQHFLYLTTDLVAIAKATGAPVVISLRNFWFRCPMGTRLYHDGTLCDRHPDLECLSCVWPDTASRKRKVIPWRMLNPALIGIHRAGMKRLLPATTEPRRILDSLSNWGTEFREMLLLADVIHSPSHFLANMVVDFGVPRNRVVVIENGIRYDTGEVLEKTASAHLRFGLVGVTPHKGAHVAIQAMHKLPYDAAELHVYGQVADDRDLARLQDMAKGANVHFLGSYPQNEMYRVFSEMDALIVPSVWYENCPTVIREAFATGTPVITSGIGGMAEAVRDGIDGFHFQVGNSDDLANKLKQLVETPQLLDEFRKNIQLPLQAEVVSEQIEAIYHRLINSKQQKGSQPSDSLLMVTIIIPAYNEEKYIRVCLDSLARQAYPAFEVMVVDDGSDDTTVSIVQSYVEQDPRFVLLRQDHQGPGEARNLAARQARGKIVLFCDADMAFAPDYVRKLVEPIVRGECLGTFSKEEYVLNYDNLWARSWNLHEGLTTDKRHPDDWPDEHDVFRAVDREKFLAVGGFSTKGAGDDHTLVKKLGEKAMAAPGAVCFHHNPDSMREVFLQARWYARGTRSTLSLGNFLYHTPPVSIARSIKRLVRYNLPFFLVFKLVFDFGILAGLYDKYRRPSQHGR
jgi:glycosyltransferase involved in cell wall biosynthesis